MFSAIGLVELSPSSSVQQCYTQNISIMQKIHIFHAKTKVHCEENITSTNLIAELFLVSVLRIIGGGGIKNCIK